jgi:hypothetical protein
VPLVLLLSLQLSLSRERAGVLYVRFFWGAQEKGREGFPSLEVFVWRKESNVGGCPGRLGGINNWWIVKKNVH